MRWDGNRNHSRWTFRRVTWPDMMELEDLWQIVGGSLELGALTELKATGSVDFKGDRLVDDGDLVRVYYSAEDDSGDSESVPVATCFLEDSRSSLTGAMVEGSASLSSVLSVLAGDGPGAPLCIPAGTAAVSKAREIAESLGLTVAATPSAYKLANAHTFEAEDSWLEVVDWLLDAAGFGSAFPDACGVVQMAPYVEPSMRPPTLVFSDDGTGAMAPTVSPSDNRAGAYNAVRLWYEDDSCGLRAVAVNSDPHDPASTVSRRRVKSSYELVTELAGDTTTEKLAALKSLARKKLLDCSTRIEYLELSFPYQPVQPNESVSVEYAEAGVSFTGSVISASISCSGNPDASVRLRKMMRPDFEPEVTGEVFWNG